MPSGAIDTPFGERLRLTLTGAVQGVGFRPFVYRVATELGLAGWVLNSAAGLSVEVEGATESLGEFLRRIETQRPAPAVVLTRELVYLAPAGYIGFEIRASADEDAKTVAILPDLATCPACLEELRDPANRRYRYPFTNCTLCGPRYSIILDIPYDRPNTTMRGFELCERCREEYTSPADRRFHAQPNACPVCGPRISFLPSAENGKLIRAAADHLRAGHILALKGIGGFQLLADAANTRAVALLRRRKRREAKPFALMMPSLEILRAYCEVSAEEERSLLSPAAPIVLLRPRAHATPLPDAVAGESPYLGVMLPYSPLHHLLMQECGFPVVATSGNLADEPIAIENQEALERLAGIADVFLLHNRPVARPCDDSVVRVARGRECVLRRARGFAPLPVRVSRALPRILAVGGHLKNAVAVALGRQVVLSQHIGDLDTLESRAAFERAIGDLCRLYEFSPDLIACDLHPDYASTLWAREQGKPVVAVQHHMAHAASCAAENDIQGTYLGVSWDGTGYGTDHTIWGSEVFLVEDCRFVRVSHLRPFRLPGGERAAKEPWRCAESLLFELGEPNPLPHEGAPQVRRMLAGNVNSPLTTSMGRLFDAVASLAGVAHFNFFEGQAAMFLERRIHDLPHSIAKPDRERYPLPLNNGVADWGPLIGAVLEDLRKATVAPLISLRFHNALAAWILEIARQAGVRQVTLSGGVFQNAFLAESATRLLEAGGVRVYRHQRIPPNDGGLALGQALIAAG